MTTTACDCYAVLFTSQGHDPRCRKCGGTGKGLVPKKALCAVFLDCHGAEVSPRASLNRWHHLWQARFDPAQVDCEKATEWAVFDVATGEKIACRPLAWSLAKRPPPVAIELTTEKFWS